VTNLFTLQFHATRRSKTRQFSSSTVFLLISYVPQINPILSDLTSIWSQVQRDIVVIGTRKYSVSVVSVYDTGEIPQSRWVAGSLCRRQGSVQWGNVTCDEDRLHIVETWRHSRTSPSTGWGDSRVDTGWSTSPRRDLLRDMVQWKVTGPQLSVEELLLLKRKKSRVRVASPEVRKGSSTKQWYFTELKLKFNL